LVLTTMPIILFTFAISLILPYTQFAFAFGGLDAGDITPSLRYLAMVLNLLGGSLKAQVQQLSMRIIKFLLHLRFTEKTDVFNLQQRLAPFPWTRCRWPFPWRQNGYRRAVYKTPAAWLLWQYHDLPRPAQTVCARP